MKKNIVIVVFSEFIFEGYRWYVDGSLKLKKICRRILFNYKSKTDSKENQF